MTGVSGLKYVFEKLPFRSPLGRQRLLAQNFITDGVTLQKELDFMEQILFFMKEEEHLPVIDAVSQTIEQMNDISQTLRHVASSATLDDIELFEIKKFALLTDKIARLWEQIPFNDIVLHDLSSVIDILDPEKTRIPHFYIYSSYDPELEILRKKITMASDEDEAEKYRWESVKKEDSIRELLSRRLVPFSDMLKQNLEMISRIDLLLAKAWLALDLGLTKPQISQKKTCYSGLFNPLVKAILENSSTPFQAVDIELYPGPCLITGANMSGKTVFLRSLALAQFMFQFGFYVPAEKAEIMPVEEIMVSIGDRQSEMNGLSSFAEEILRIDGIIAKAREGKRVLVLVDELARTTNPDEGKAIVNAFIEVMSRYSVISVITTHYNGIETPVRKLRVKGLILDNPNNKITPENIHQHMDYSLVESDTATVPMEALKIADIFNVDNEFLKIARNFLDGPA